MDNCVAYSNIFTSLCKLSLDCQQRLVMILWKESDGVSNAVTYVTLFVFAGTQRRPKSWRPSQQDGDEYSRLL